MFNSNILDVAVGLVFVFLTLSLICSAAKEIIEAGLKKRSKDLERGIRELLGDLSPQARPGQPQNGAAQNPAPDQQAPGAAAGNPSADEKPSDFVEALYNHGLINALYQGKYREANTTGSLPSYIPATNFALAVLSLRDSYKTNQKQLPQNLQDALEAFEKKAQGKLDVLQQELESWFNSAMDRVSGWYKRRTQWILLALGFVVAIAVNADAIGIARRLSTDTNFRQAVARMAEAAAAKPSPSQGQPAQTGSGKGTGQGTDATNGAKGTAAGTATDASGSSTASSAAPGQDNGAGAASGAAANGNGSVSNSQGSGTDTSAAVNQIKENLADLDGIGLPLGWVGNPIKTPLDFFLRLIGWLITALAVSVGAPFWFDMLNKIMVVRSTIKPGEKSGQGTKK